MKFLLELVSCCGSSSSSQQPTSLPKEERRLLVGHVSARRRANRVIRGVKRGRYSGGSVVGDWQPSLSSISEEHVVFYEEKGRRRVEEVVVSADGSPSASNNLKRNKVLSTTKTRHSRSLGDDIGWTTFQAMPAFSPAPFMF